MKGKHKTMRINLRCLIIRENKLIVCKNIKDGFYFLPGGGLEEGETINQCIVRELKEELDINPNEILIDKNTDIIEHIFESNGTKYHEINLIKNVYINVEYIKSCEDHIAFEEINLEKLKDYNLLPLKIKNAILEKFNL